MSVGQFFCPFAIPTQERPQNRHSGQDALNLRYVSFTSPIAAERGGLTLSVGGDHDLAALLQRADSALYAAKQGGCNRVVVG